MQNRALYFLFFIIISCSKPENTEFYRITPPLDDFNCDALVAAILAADDETLELMINDKLENLDPYAPTPQDRSGHEINTHLFLEKLDECIEIDVNLICYACMKSLPAQTSIFLEIEKEGNLLQRHLSIYVPEGDQMYFGRID